MDAVGQRRRSFGSRTGAAGLQETRAHRGGLRQPQLQVAHVAAADGLGEAGHAGLADAGLARQFVDACRGGAGQVFQHHLRDLLLGQAQRGAALGDAGQDVEGRGHGWVAGVGPGGKVTQAADAVRRGYNSDWRGLARCPCGPACGQRVTL
ncbi:hypothetical protein D9M72_560820 [compost metagenome]